MEGRLPSIQSRSRTRNAILLVNLLPHRGIHSWERRTYSHQLKGLVHANGAGEALEVVKRHLPQLVVRRHIERCLLTPNGLYRQPPPSILDLLGGRLKLRIRIRIPWQDLAPSITGSVQILCKIV